MSLQLEDKKITVKEIILNTLKGGFWLVLPTFGMIYIIYFILNFIISLLSPLTNFLSKFLHFPDWLVILISGFMILSICFLCGTILNTKIGKFSYLIFEKILKKIKLYKIFNILQEIYSQFFGTKEKVFTESVICYPYGRDLVGFSGLISSRWSNNGKNYISVFIPTCPNFSSGFLKHIPEENVDVLAHVPVDKMMRTVIACGAGTDEFFKSKQLEPDNTK